MNRGFGFYYGKAIKSSATTIWKNKNFFKVLVFWFMELIGRLCLLGPVFDLAKIRQAKLAKNYREASVSENFKVACRATSIWTMICAIVIEALMALAGVVIIAIAGGLFVALGALIGSYAAPSQMEIFIIVFSVPVGIVLLTFLFIASIMFSPTAYVVASNPGIGAAEAVSASLRTMRERGKTTVFLIGFITSLILGAIAGVLLTVYLMLEAILPTSEYASIMTLLFAIVCVAAIVTTVPMFLLAARVALYSLFEDVALDSVNAMKNTTGINVRRYTGMQYDTETIGNTLTGLFDETTNDEVPLPNSELRKKKRSEAFRKEAEYRKAREAEEANAARSEPQPTASEPLRQEPPREEPLRQEPLREEPPKQEPPREEPPAREPLPRTEAQPQESADTANAEPFAQSGAQPFGQTSETNAEAAQPQESAEASEQSAGAFGQTFEQASEQTAEPSEQATEQATEQPNESYGQTEGREESAASDEEFVFSSSDTDGSASSDGGWNGEWPTDSE